jgi:hypothetical protein
MQYLAYYILGVVVGLTIIVVAWVWKTKIYPRRRRICNRFKKSIPHHKETDKERKARIINERYPKPEKDSKRERTLEEKIDDDDLWTPLN